MKKIFLFILLILFLGVHLVRANTQTPAKDITVNATVFTQNLNNTDTDVQKALVTIDTLNTTGGSGGVNNLDGGTSNTNYNQTSPINGGNSQL